MAIASENSLMPRDSFIRPESDDEESFVVLGHSLSPEFSENIQNDLSDAIGTTVVHDAVQLTNCSLERMNSSTPSFPLMPSIQTRDVSLNTIGSHYSADLSPDEIQQKVDMLVEENLKLKETLHQNNLAMKKQYDTLVLWQNDVMAVHKSHKEKFSETKVYIEKLKMEKAELINMVHLKEAEVTLFMEELTELKCVKNKQISQSSFDNLTEFELESSKKKIVELERQLENEKSKLASEVSAKEGLQRQVEDLRTELAKYQMNNDQSEKNFNKLKRESESLQKILLDEIKTLKDKIMTESNEQHHTQKVEEQLMAAQMHITELQISSGKDKEVINTNEQKIQQLEKQVEEILADNKALQVQVDVYSADFQAEQQAKQAVGVEKEKIAEDLRNIQRRNQQLHNELERLRKHEYVYVGKEEAAEAAAAQETTQYICPKCSRKYPNYHALEDHVYRCIEIDNLF